MKKQKKSFRERLKELDNLEITIIIVSIIFILFSFLSPYFFTNFLLIDDLNFTKTGEIGDTIGGIMNPFIAISGVLLTFLAFYIQFKANQQQRDLFRDELNSNKFENQFYEMLRLHKENVNEISLNISSYKSIESKSFLQNEKIVGRETFKYFLDEIKILYHVAKKRFPDNSPDNNINLAYGVFFHGVNPSNKKLLEQDTNDPLQEFIKDVDYIYRINKDVKNRDTNQDFKIAVNSKAGLKNARSLNYNVFQGNSAQLAHYYRHLYQTVKFITKQDDEFLSYEAKRNYLRILRSQLSNQEQAMLFYNWKSHFGGNWENDKNKFFTDYRMIHNLYNDYLIDDFKLEKIFDLKKYEYKKEKNRIDDSLFESEDWK